MRKASMGSHLNVWFPMVDYGKELESSPAGGGAPLGMGFAVSIVHVRPSVPLSLCLLVRMQVLSHCSSACLLPATTITD